jgi:hypothetical protein
MNDREITEHIGDLVAEEHRLENAHPGAPLSDTDQERLTALGVELDRCWDLLRQRRARREFGEDPSGTRERSARVVEGYQQ